MIPVLTTDRLTLGPLTEDVFEPLADFYASDRSRFVGGPKSRALTWRQLAAEIGHWTLRGYGRFAVTETATGTFVGIAGPWCPEGWPEPELSWDLMAGFEGRGFATESARAALDWCYRDKGWTTAISLVDSANAGSAAVAARLGASWESMHDLQGYGLVQVWRHPGPKGAT